MVAEQSDPGFRYWAFISYSHQDASWGRWLHRALETYRVPARIVGQPIAAGAIPARLAPVFRDRDELPTATDLDRTVAEALRQSWALVVVCSPAAAQSRWVNEEVREFQRLGRGARIHCLIVDGAPDALAGSCFPPALREGHWQSGRAGEPIAADVRRGGDGKSDARLKLVAGILGIRFDTLVQREHQRGYRRMAWLASGAVCALAVLAVFTFLTVTSRRDAEAQRSHAEGLVEFMLGDLRRKLQPEGKLGTLDAVGKEALAYYAAQDPASLDADALARRARALHLIGDVYDQRGELDDALGVFRQAAASTAELLARAPGDAQRIFDHAQSVYWVGLIAFQRGQIPAAQGAFESYAELAGRLVALDAANPAWQAEVEYADNSLGALLLDRGRTAEAEVRFTRVLQIAQDLATRQPNDSARRFELAQAHAWMADVRVAQSRLGDAIAERVTEVGLYEGMLSDDGKNRAARAGLMVAERELARIAGLRGDSQLALVQLRRATAIGNELLDSDPDNAVTHAQASAAFASLAEVLQDGGDMQAAQAAIARAHQLAAAAVKRDASVVDWQTRLGISLLLEVRMTPGLDSLEALRRVQGVLQRLDALRPLAYLDSKARHLYAEGLLMAGDCDASLGNWDAARNSWRRVGEELAFATANPFVQATLTEARARLAQPALPGGNPASVGASASGFAADRPNTACAHVRDARHLTTRDGTSPAAIPPTLRGEDP